MVNIAVLMKQVPLTQNVKMDKNGFLIRENLELCPNPDDLHALESAIQVKEKYTGKITAISMGPPQAIEILYEAKAMGADDAIIISDPAFKGSDTYITAKVLSMVIQKYGPFDLIFSGVEAIDGNTAQVPFQISQQLGFPLIYQYNNLMIENGYLIGDRIKGHEFQHFQVKLPVLLTANKQINRPRYYNLARVNHAFDQKITLLTTKDLNLSADQVGINASPTQVLKISQVSRKRTNIKLEGTDKEISQKLIETLTRNNLLKT